MKLRLLAFLITLTVAAPPALAMSEAQYALQQDAKKFVLDVVLRSLTFSAESYRQSHITQDARFYTRRGCKTFIATMDHYTILDNVFDDQQAMTAKLWDRKLNVEPFEQIYVDETNDQDEYTSWRMEVPVKLYFGTPDSAFPTVSRYIASVTVSTQQGDAQNRFRIESWHTKRDVEGRQATNYSDLGNAIRFEDSAYPECNKIKKDEKKK